MTKNFTNTEELRRAEDYIRSAMWEEDDWLNERTAPLPKNISMEALETAAEKMGVWVQPKDEANGMRIEACLRISNADYEKNLGPQIT